MSGLMMTEFQIPEWLHKSFHGANVDTFSPKFVSFLSIVAVVLVVVFVISLIFNKLERENPMKAKLAELDRQLFKARNEAMILKRQMDTAKKSATVVAAATSEGHEAANDVHLYKELESVRAERDQVSWLL